MVLTTHSLSTNLIVNLGVYMKEQNIESPSNHWDEFYQSRQENELG